MGATIKFGAFTETFSHCTIGMAGQKIRRSSTVEKEPSEKLQSSSSVDSATVAPKGMFPSLMERAFLPQIVSQVRQTPPLNLVQNNSIVLNIFTGSKLFLVTIAKHIFK